jgi:hypothetical protein
MNPAIALRMIGADFLKLRKKRGTLIWALVLTVAPLLIYFIVKTLQHSSSPMQNSPAACRDHGRRRRRCGRSRGGGLP